MEHEVSSLFEFLKKSPTAFHAVDALCGIIPRLRSMSPLYEDFVRSTK